jgi:hypothetical protein
MARPLYPREWPGIHCIEGWVCPRAGLDRCGMSRRQYSSESPPWDAKFTGLKEINFEDLEELHLVQDRTQWYALVNTVMNLWIPQTEGNVTSLAAISFSQILFHEVGWYGSWLVHYLITLCDLQQLFYLAVTEVTKCLYTSCKECGKLWPIAKYYPGMSLEVNPQ